MALTEFTHRRIRSTDVRATESRLIWCKTFAFMEASESGQIVVDVWDRPDGKPAELPGIAVVSVVQTWSAAYYVQTHAAGDPGAHPPPKCLSLLLHARWHITRPSSQLLGSPGHAASMIFSYCSSGCQASKVTKGAAELERADTSTGTHKYNVAFATAAIRWRMGVPMYEPPARPPPANTPLRPHPNTTCARTLCRG